MLTFNGRVKITGGTFKTWQELIIAAITARTYVSAEAKARDLSMWRGAVAQYVKFTPLLNVYIANSWKGNVNGVLTQSAWAAGDMTASPGGGKPLDGGIEYIFGAGTRVELANRMVYAAADTEIDLDVTCFP